MAAYARRPPFFPPGGGKAEAHGYVESAVYSRIVKHPPMGGVVLIQGIASGPALAGAGCQGWIIYRFLVQQFL